MNRRNFCCAVSVSFVGLASNLSLGLAQNDPELDTGLFQHKVESLPKAGEETLQAVLVGEVADGSFACIVHNNTQEDRVITQVIIDGNAVLAMGNPSPFVIAAGQYALAVFYVGDDVPDTTVPEVEFDAEDAQTSSANDLWGYREATITELEIDGSRAKGRFENTSDDDFSGNTEVTIVFLDGDGEIVGFVSEYAQTRDVASGETGEFDLMVMYGQSSDRYLAAAQGKIY
ncbi:MAG: FxLYD domain-containing protein [Thermomicrobiales bacterium]|nr:FxLYD domain-containing protein [Thermomicrobiales bacterium]MCO5226754.1 FxLYD domain-containing protein [Thermomicrobiales bacterium]